MQEKKPSKHIEDSNTTLNKVDLIVLYRILHPPTEEYTFSKCKRKI